MLSGSGDVTRAQDVTPRGAAAATLGQAQHAPLHTAVVLPPVRDDAPMDGDADPAATAQLRRAVEQVLGAPRDPSAIDMLEHAVGAHSQAMARLGLPRHVTVDTLRSIVADLLEASGSRPSAAVVALVLWRSLGWALAPTG